MRSRLGALRRSLGIRLVLPLSITVGLVLAVHAFLSFRTTQDHFLRLVHADIERSSDLIRRATHDGMLLNRLDEVQATIDHLASGRGVAAIRVYDKAGHIVLSARDEEIGQKIQLESETCRSCHGPEETKIDAVLQRSSLASGPEGDQVLRRLSVIENEPRCATAACHYHPADRRALGVLDVEMSMAPLDAAVASSETQMIWTTIVLILIIGVMAAVFVERVVHRPASALYEGTRRLAGGELDTRIEVRGSHELAYLAEAFNHMAGDLGAAQREITEWSQTLERKVIEKTKALDRAQRQVLHMEKMASLGKLSASVAHEINNPIGGLLTYARLVRRELDDQPLEADVREELQRYLLLIERECIRCGEIVKNLLVFARRTGSEMAPADLNEIVDRSLMLVRHHLEISGVQLHRELLAADSEIVADADQLQQALLALLVNAVEAMSQAGDGEGDLTVRLRGDADDVWIEVADTGVGIDPDVLPHIFDPFFSTKLEESGVGLGLAVVYGIVHRHGGVIDVESSPGCGATFTIRLSRRSKTGEEVTTVAESSPVAAGLNPEAAEETAR